MAEIKSGTRINGRYTLKEFKGSGTFGEVWLAHDEVLDTDIAIKIYISLDNRGTEEFKSEYITTMGISHPNLLTTTYFDIWEHHPFLVMRYCEKGSVSRYAGEMDEKAIWQLIHDVASGLKCLHELPEPIIHQDIKPDNILVSSTGRYLITDFGISKRMRSTMRKQSQRAVGAGATAYMGPERFDSDPSPVKASDIWSLGASIYEMATGELPFNGLGGVMQKNGAELPELGSKWSRELNMVMQACLAKETWDRPTASQLEEYTEESQKGRIPQITWNRPEESAVSDMPSQIPDYEDDDPKDWSWKKKLGFSLLVALLIMGVGLIIDSTCKGLHGSTSGGYTIADSAVDSVIEESITVVTVVEAEAMPDSIVTSNEVLHPRGDNGTKTEKSKSAVVIEPKVASPKEMKTEEISPKGNAALLKKALADGDYRQVQKLANEGYAAAYGPLANYYMRNHDYATAERYAKKAQSAGFQEGSTVIETLRRIGYYD